MIRSANQAIMIDREFHLLEVLDKAHEGKFCEKKEWDLKLVPGKAREIIKERHLEGVYDPQQLLPCDDSLADAFFEAGFELATSTGLSCLTTQRVIKFSEEEIRAALKDAPSQLSLGEGDDAVTIHARRPEDTKPAVPMLGPLGCIMSERLYIPILQSIAQYREIPILLGGLPNHVRGREIKARTPYETYAGKYHAALDLEVLRRAGRPGMPLQGRTFGTEYGCFGSYGVPGAYRSRDGYEIFTVSELKTDYMMLQKLVHAYLINAVMGTNHWSMFGGYVNPLEANIVVAVASNLLQQAFLLCHINGSGVLDTRTIGDSERHALYGCSMTAQAISRNTTLLKRGTIRNVSGPCTEMILHEAAALSLMLAVSGNATIIGVGSAGGRYPDHLSGLENKFAAEVIKAAAGMKRSTANEIVKELVPRYEDKLMYPPKGKSFTECFDVETLKPKQEWLDIYEKAWNELEELGVKRPS